MPTYLHPGVYIEEIPSGAKPIEGVATSVAAFVGQAVKGPAGEAVLVNTLDDYVNEFGNVASENDLMGLAVQAFYLNGGKSAYICRIVGEGSSAASDSATGQDSGGADVIRISASSVGEWGNSLHYRIVKPDQDALTFDLEVGELDGNGEFAAQETFQGLSMNSADSDFVLTRVNGESANVEVALETAADPDEGANLLQDATLTGGPLDGTVATLFSAASWPMNLTLNLNGLGAELVVLNPAGLAGDHNADGAAVAAEIQNQVQSLGTDSVHQGFGCTYNSGTNRFELESSEDGSEASIEVYSGDAASLLRLGPDQTASLTGAVLGNVTDTAFSAFANPMSLTLNIDDHGDQTITLTDLDLQGADHDTDGQEVARGIQNAVRAIDPAVAAYKDFSCSYDGGTNQFTLDSGSGYSRSSSITVADDGSGSFSVLVGLDTGTTLLGGRQVDQGTSRIVPAQAMGLLDNGIQLTGGTESLATALDYGDFYNNILRKVRDASIIVLPGQPWASDGSGNPFVAQTLAHAEAMQSRMVIVDPPPDFELDQGATVDGLGLPTSTYSTLYYPWVKVANPFFNEDTNPNAAKTLTIAPSAFAAGMWSKVDGRRGVWKAPAGVETRLTGAAGLEFIVEDGEQGQLNPLGVNCIRTQPGFGPVFWGARTLATKAAPEWRYVPVRRTAIFIERSIYEGIQWAVFEPNDEPLWGSLRANIGAFMNGLFRAGAFQGATAKDAYFVRCGLGDTMTQADIDRGQVIAIVGFAPLKPAEFVIIRIQQKVNQQ